MQIITPEAKLQVIAMILLMFLNLTKIGIIPSKVASPANAVKIKA